MKAVLTGATGLIGGRLLEGLEDARVLSRSPERAARRLGVDAHAWNPSEEPAPASALEGADVIFHLAGEPVAEGRWSAEKKRRIRDSRVVGTRHLVEGIARTTQRPRVLVAASAVGYYGDRGDEELDECSAAGTSFLADVCAAWEREAMEAERLGVRVVCVRIGIVLATDGGALARMLTPFKLGMGGRLAGGDQWMPWIHVDDVVGILRLAATSDIRGAINATAPHPVTNRNFTAALGRALGRPAILPIPRAALRLAFGQVSAVLVASQRVLPGVAQRAGYVFEHPHLDGALGDLLGTRASEAA